MQGAAKNRNSLSAGYGLAGLGHLFKIGARAKHATFTGEDRHLGAVIGLEFLFAKTKPVNPRHSLCAAPGMCA